ncbi:MAG: hypothetical protein M2R45_05470 [Verrucomicrobia subdivision 3 bacterium]|nr:hypothetical protein [Limisphaerales bacterium]MCS1417895.1 hypothetical protein [Limisphaerales bacterium]
MPFDEPRLKDKGKTHPVPWQIGDIPDRILYAIGKQIVRLLAVGHDDISGADFGDIFAEASEGKHLAKPLGVSDVVANGLAWSVKTIKTQGQPREQRIVRLISGRNSPDFSHGITDPHADAHATGRAVLGIWNKRISLSLVEHHEIRLMVLIRDIETKKFVLFEQPIAQYPADDYHWEFKKTSRGNENLQGYERSTKRHCFTWQPHGSQFTIIRDVPGSARPFAINHKIPSRVDQAILDLTGYTDDWITIG